jgi:hypothetical protein
MNHQEATGQAAVEKYLLNELAPPLRDEFEQHFFGCTECTADLRATAAFLEAAKTELKLQADRGPAVAPTPRARMPAAPSKKSWFTFLGRPAVLSPAFALLLLVVIYQNVAVYPRLTNEVAQLSNPEILPTLSLVSGNSRGAASTSISVGHAQSFLLAVDIPTRDQFSSYELKLVAPSGATAWSLPASAQAAKDTVSVRVPVSSWSAGDYTLIVQGHEDRGPAGANIDLAHYRFTLNKNE